MSQLASATWLWLPILVIFLVQGLHCPPSVKFVLHKFGRYYIVGAVGLQLLLPASHLTLRTVLFDLSTRTFLLIEAGELLWFGWSAWRTGTYQHLQLPDEEFSIRLLIWYAVSALLYLGWAALGIAFAFTLAPGM